MAQWMYRNPVTNQVFGPVNDKEKEAIKSNPVSRHFEFWAAKEKELEITPKTAPKVESPIGVEKAKPEKTKKSVDHGTDQ